MSRERRRARERRRNQRRVHSRQSASYLAVLELDGISDPIKAQSLLSYLGLPPSGVLAAEGRPALAAYRSSTELDDCLLISEDERMLGVLHGTDCSLSAYIDQYLGKRLPNTFAGRCARHAAGGLFRVLDINDMAGSA